ncbi:hypothetical protein PHLGIDRAFT_118747 [Phlebiopsis gigantea 11061_1 CR5-6]|uniref:Serine protease inhibitor n=1 Tax=Phlebiopsis gigantea (strain 11061_1 CR5-6) TaxID=745531 RepID=A0A0C3PK98_PHLG1|nr:hypothetical protein PHLGIDRAFT_118747 [Phlebiopsis gigantea 11061_1 CR5-6]
MSPILPDGQYKIFNLGTGLLVGRRAAEDLSFRPKGIFTLDPDVWTIENTGDGTFKLQAFGAPVGERDGLLWAFLLNSDQANAGEWRIVSIPQMGKDCYLITKPDLETGWVADKEPNEQIKVKPLIVLPSFPPKYPTSEVFVIKPAHPE